ncbi:MAG TPA: hypothetical protein VIS72_07875 [Anaerolineales bacterium]
MEQLKHLPAILISGLASFFALGFFQNFYPSLGAFIFLAVFLNVMFTLIFDVILSHAAITMQKDPKEKLIPIATLGLGILWVILTFRLLAQYPELFSFDFFLPTPELIPSFLGLTTLSQIGVGFFLQKLDSTNWLSFPFFTWIKRNIPGLLLASAIAISSYALATVLVEAEHGFADNYFDTDSPFWLNFITAAPDQMMTMRAVHPIALLTLRPPAWMLSLLLNGEKFHSAILLNSLFGGICAYLTWSFFKQRTDSTAYSLLIASLLGFSTSHLLLSVFLESYIFSAAALIAFLVLLQAKDRSLPSLVPLGLLTFGITITNFIQTCIAFFLTRRNIKDLFMYVFIVLALAVILAFVQHILYPSSEPFYITENLTGESSYRYDLFEVPAHVAVSRANVIFRNITLFSIVAPRPLILLEEIGCTFPCFNTIRYFRGAYLYASYIGYGSLLARTWFVLLIVAGGIFVWKLFKSPRNTSLQAALALNLVFNFILHMNYGDDPLLYSPNWTYALVFFFGMSFEKFADKKWLQVALLTLITAIMFNNMDLFRKILEAVLPFGP